VKDGYRLLDQREHNDRQVETMLWRMLWGMKNIIPRVKLFLWKACNDGLPTAAATHRRLPSISPVCARCHEENEYLSHMLFFCPSSRAVWFGSRMNLRIDGIPLDFKQALKQLMQWRSPGDQRYMAHLLWCIWKARCAEVIEGIRFNPYRVCLQAAGMDNVPVEPVNMIPRQVHNRHSIQDGDSVVFIDASWDTSGKAGAGVIQYDPGGKLMEVRYFSYKAGDAMHAETVAAAIAVESYLARWPQGKCTFFTDCQSLITDIQRTGEATTHSWRAEEQVLKLRNLTATAQLQIKVRYVNRKHLVAPHKLANFARRTRGHYRGMPTSSFMVQHGITRDIDRRMVTIVYDDGG
jgi:zinc-binding in reverse transcriptase